MSRSSMGFPLYGFHSSQASNTASGATLVDVGSTEQVYVQNITFSVASAGTAAGICFLSVGASTTNWLSFPLSAARFETLNFGEGYKLPADGDILIDKTSTASVYVNFSGYKWG